MKGAPGMWDGSEYQQVDTVQEWLQKSSGLDFSPIESRDISTIVEHIVASSWCRQKWSRLDKIIRLSTDTKLEEQKVRTGVYNALGLSWPDKLLSKQEKISFWELREELGNLDTNLKETLRILQESNS